MILRTKLPETQAEPVTCSMVVDAKFDNGEECRLSFESLPASTLTAVLRFIHEHRRSAQKEGE